MKTPRVSCWLPLLAGLAMAPMVPAAEPAPRTAEPEARRVVLEDDAVRIEELRVRGQVQKISVTPKASGARPYEIVPPDSSRDASQPRGLAGQRVWNLFSF
ncbi:MAG TPA: hypothetical protein PL196_08570 [Burkholderiaceae bacterium]|nr:hypothetical protein [Burkholderiaceae bacterium]